jgi:uncharacterized protein YutE (UPF0331/DUF86 family)
MAAWLRDAAGLRNVLVRGCAEVDPGILSDVLARRLGDLNALARANT